MWSVTEIFIVFAVLLIWSIFGLVSFLRWLVQAVNQPSFDVPEWKKYLVVALSGPIVWVLAALS